MDDQHKEPLTVKQLEQQRELINQRLDDQRARINARLDKKKAKLTGQLNRKQEEIVAVALELLDAVGLSNLSLRAIAKQLAVRPPALYWHFQNKEALVDFMAEAILQGEFKDARPRQKGETWQDWLVAHASRLRKAMLAHRDGGRVVAGAHIYPAMTLVEWFEDAFVALTSAGLDLQTARHILMTASRYTFGYVIEEQAGPTPEEQAHTDLPASIMRLEAFAARYPNFAAAIHEAERTGASAEEDFVVGLEYIINGTAKA